MGWDGIGGAGLGRAGTSDPSVVGVLMRPSPFGEWILLSALTPPMATMQTDGGPAQMDSARVNCWLHARDKRRIRQQQQQNRCSFAGGQRQGADASIPHSIGIIPSVRRRVAWRSCFAGRYPAPISSQLASCWGEEKRRTLLITRPRMCY